MLADPLTIAQQAVSGLSNTTWARSAKLQGGYTTYTEAAGTVLLPHILSLNSNLDSTGSYSKLNTIIGKLRREFASGTSGYPDVVVAPRLVIDYSLEATDTQIRNEIARLYDFFTTTIIGQMRKGNL